MTIIDVRTLFVTYVVSSALGTAVMASLWLQNRKRSPEIILWPVNYALQFIAFLLIALRGAIPDFVSIVLANALIVAGAVILFRGLERYVGKESRQLHNYVMVIVFTLLHAYLTFVYPSLALRNVNLSLALIFICVQISWLMLRRVDLELRPATRATGIISAALGLVSLANLLANLTLPQANDLFRSGLIDASALLAYQILFIALTYTLFLLFDRRLLMALERKLVEIQQVEDALKRNEEQIRLLLYSTAEAIYGIDLQGNCTFANPSCLRMLGYADMGQLLGQNMHRLIHHSYPDGSPMPVDVCKIYRAFREGKGVHVDDEVLWKADGASFPAEYWSYPQRVNGEISGAVVTFINITKRKQAEKALKENQQKFQGLVETLYDWIWEVDSQGHYTYVSPQLKSILGYEPQEILGKTPFNLMPPEEAKSISEKFEALVMERKPIAALENINIHKDGHLIRLETNGLPFYDADGNFKGYRGTDRDITARKQAEELLASERQRLAYILEGTNVGTWEWNIQTGETIFNERWAEIIGYTLTELAPVSIDTWIKFTHPDDLKASDDLLKKHFRKELPYYECEARMQHKNGRWVWVLDRGKVATWTEDGKPLVMSGTHQDITKRKLAEEKVQHMATHDGLTDLPSLRLAEDRLSMALRLSRRHKNRTAVMFIDLDGFKAVNDTLGHDAGDYVLKQVAQRLLSCVRETDTVARVGGDEFLLIATGLRAPENAAQIAEKVVHLLSQPITFNKQRAAIGASLGIALYPDHGKNADQLIKQADEAMYRIKSAGKNGFNFANAAIK